jgi:hypothetical protein
MSAGEEGHLTLTGGLISSIVQPMV